jgi:chromosome segregation ATPase
MLDIGDQVSSEQYDSLIGDIEEQIAIQQAIAEYAQVQLDNLGELDENNASVWADWTSTIDNAKSSIQQLTTSIREYKVSQAEAAAGIPAMEKNLDIISDAIHDKNAEITEYTNRGMDAPEQMYRDLASSYEERAKQNRSLSAIYGMLANKPGYSEAEKKAWKEKQNSAMDEALAAEASALENKLIPY